MTGTCQITTSIDSPVVRPSRSPRGVANLAGILLAVLVLAMSACGGSDGDDAPTASASESSSTSDTSDAGDDAAEAAPAPSLDLTPISDCIAAADIVVAPTAFSQNFMDEQGLAGVLDLGALGIEFGGGQVFFYETQEGADQKVATLEAGGTEDAVLQEGTVVVQYASAVQDEAAALVMGCATA